MRSKLKKNGYPEGTSVLILIQDKVHAYFFFLYSFAAFAFAARPVQSTMDGNFNAKKTLETIKRYIRSSEKSL